MRRCSLKSRPVCTASIASLASITHSYTTELTINTDLYTYILHYRDSYRKIILSWSSCKYQVPYHRSQASTHSCSSISHNKKPLIIPIPQSDTTHQQDQANATQEENPPNRTQNPTIPRELNNRLRFPQYFHLAEPTIRHVAISASSTVAGAVPSLTCSNA